MTHKKILYTVAYVTIFFISVQLFSCTDCSKKVDCAAYEDALLDAWFPYQKADKLVFATNTGLTRTMTVGFVMASDPYQTRESRGACEAYKMIRSVQNDSLGNPDMDLRLLKIERFSDNLTERRLEMSLLRNYIHAANLQDNGFTGWGNSNSSSATGIPPQFHPSIQLNGKTFTNVQSVYFDTLGAKRPSIYKIYISKMNGLVAYETLEGSLLWVKQ
jgi:hypothetical protein